MRNLDLVFKFEDMNPRYMDEQIEGLILELQRKFKSKDYLLEKLENIKRHFNSVLDNFSVRIMHDHIQEKFSEFVEMSKRPEKSNLVDGVKYQKLLDLKGDEIAVFHNYGITVMEIGEFQKWDEEASVTCGEQGHFFKVFAVVNSTGAVYEWKEAQEYFVPYEESD